MDDILIATKLLFFLVSAELLPKYGKTEPTSKEWVGVKKDMQINSLRLKVDSHIRASRSQTAASPASDSVSSSRLRQTGISGFHKEMAL